MGVYIQILVPVTALLAGVISAFTFKEFRLKAFTLALLSSFIFSGIAIMLNETNSDYKLDSYYQENPLQRADNDPLNPLTIDFVSPLPRETNLGDTVKISVFAHNNLTSGNVIPVRMEVMGKKIFYRITPDNVEVIDKEEGISEEYETAGLQETEEISADGRSIYQGSVTVPLTMSDGSPIERVRVFFANYTIDDASGFINLYQRK